MSDVLVSLVSQQVDTEGEISDISLTTEGKYYEKAGFFYITYKESRLTGLEGTTTLLKIAPDQISVIRMGSIETKQVFSVGKRYFSTYITPFGTFEMVINPWTVDVCMAEGEGHIYLEYDLEIDNRPFSRNSLRIEVKKLRG